MHQNLPYDTSACPSSKCDRQTFPSDVPSVAVVRKLLVKLHIPVISPLRWWVGDLRFGRGVGVAAPSNESIREMASGAKQRIR